MTRPIDLSVVIPCRNGAADLPGQLAALADQEWDGTWEVVVADNGSTDDTRAVVESFVGKIPRLRVVDASARPGRHHACNVGARFATGGAVLFVDADDLVASGYLAAMARALEKHGVVAARLDHSIDPSWMRGVASEVQTTGLQNGFDFLPFGCGASLGFRRAIFDEIGGFREHATFCEDVDICWRAQLAGYDIAFVRDAVVMYRSRATPKDMFHQHRNYSRSWPLLYREFQRAGMPRRSTRTAVTEWFDIVRSVPRLRTQAEKARWARRAGKNLGRLEGSLRYRTWFP